MIKVPSSAPPLQSASTHRRRRRRSSAPTSGGGAPTSAASRWTEGGVPGWRSGIARRSPNSACRPRTRSRRLPVEAERAAGGCLRSENAAVGEHRYVLQRRSQHAEQRQLLYFGMNGAVGWVDLAAWDKTHDSEASQGWSGGARHNGDGRIAPGWTEPTSRSIRPAIIASTSVLDRGRSEGRQPLVLGDRPRRQAAHAPRERIEPAANLPGRFYEPPLDQKPEVFGLAASKSITTAWRGRTGGPAVT